MRITQDREANRTLPMDLTPMVDVVFLLIIFFLTTSSLIEVTRANVDLPKQPGEQATDRERGFVVNITRNGTIVVQDRTLTFDQLASALRAEQERAGGALDVVVRADRESSLAHINRVATHLGGMGVRSWRLATEVPAP